MKNYKNLKGNPVYMFSRFVKANFFTYSRGSAPYNADLNPFYRHTKESYVQYLLQHTRNPFIGVLMRASTRSRGNLIIVITIIQYIDTLPYLTKFNLNISSNIAGHQNPMN